MSFLDDILQVKLSSNEYVKEKHKKKQIYLHHTAGNASGKNTVNYWNNDTRGRIATCVCISNTGASEGDGKIVQAFSSKYWAYHLGIKREVFESYNLDYMPLDKSSIGIELCAWGGLEEKSGKFYNYVNREVPKEEVCILDEPYKGSLHYHRYSDEQIRSVENLLRYWIEYYDIERSYNARDMWGVSKKALRGESGIFTHNSVRKDKSDIFPQPEIIEMLKLL
jgi:N-acetyl-anhydromuramyl-L-alanine amidase AmpD